MKKGITTIPIIFLIFINVTLACIAGQQLSLDDMPRRDLNRETVEDLRLDATQRTALDKAMKARDYARAEKLLVEEIERNPKPHALLTLLGGVFFLDGKYLNSAIAMKRADKLLPLDDRNRFILALDYIILKHRDWARPELEKLNRSDPRNPLYVYWLGRLEYEAMQFKGAAANLRKALILDPAFIKAYDNLGLTDEALGQYDDAVRVYQQAVSLNRQQKPPSAWPPLNLGTLLVKLERFPEAERYLYESLRYDARFPKAHYQLGLLLEKEKKDNEAVLELTQAAKLDPSYPEPHYVLGRIYQRAGDKTKAETEWQLFQNLRKDISSESSH